LIEVQNQSLGTLVKLPERAIKWIIDEAQEIFKSQPMMLDISVIPGNTLTIVGDVHGQYYDLLRIFDYGGHPSKDRNYLFIGDYVDRGKQSIEVITLLLAYKVKYPLKFNLLRGNHEC
jgi:serine/threonine-protein phosphatase PP1 catalytic subunit